MVIFPGLNSSHKCYCHQLPPYKWSSSSNINKFLKDLMCWLLLVIWFECKISRTISNPRLEITCFNPVELTPQRQRGEDLDTPQPRLSMCLMGMLQWRVVTADCCCDDVAPAVMTCQPPATSGAATDNTSDTQCEALSVSSSWWYGRDWANHKHT